MDYCYPHVPYAVCSRWHEALQGDVCLLREWSENRASHLLPKLIDGISNSCTSRQSLRTSHFLSVVDIYAVTVSACRGCDSSLSEAVLGVFAAVHKAITYLSPTARWRTLRRSSFCAPFSTQQSRKMSYFPARQRMGIWNHEIFSKVANHVRGWLGVSVHEWACKTGIVSVYCDLSLPLMQLKSLRMSWTSEE